MRLPVSLARIVVILVGLLIAPVAAARAETTELRIPGGDPGIEHRLLHKVPSATLVVRGDRDSFADPALAAKLTSAASVREVVVPLATHWLPHEAQRATLLDETARLLQGS